MTLDLNPSFAFYFDLPWPISYLPKICRILALIYIAPPVFLFLFDIGQSPLHILSLWNQFLTLSFFLDPQVVIYSSKSS